MSGSQPYKSVKVDLVVQDYMDSMLADLFPDVVAEPVITEAVLAEPVISEPVLTEPVISEPVISEPVLAEPVIDEPVLAEPVPTITPPQLDTSASVELKQAVPPPQSDISQPATDIEPKPVSLPDSAQEVEELKYPKAPQWAQQEFDVLLFDVCGLKLAVSMEALGRIIKVEQELNQLIGRPPWFMGAHTENEQSLYVVDTAKFIMPEKGFDLAQMGFGYIIQLQRSHWTLACKEVYSTVRIQPDQVKWRSNQGKRPWLAGTVIEHMCALIHVDSLVALLESENT